MKNKFLSIVALVLLVVTLCSCFEGEEAATTEGGETTAAAEKTTDESQVDTTEEKNMTAEEETTEAATTEEAEVPAFDSTVELLKFRNGTKGMVTFCHDDGDLATMDWLTGKLKQYGVVCTANLITNRFVDVSTGELKTAEVEKWQKYLDTGLFQFESHTRTHTLTAQSDGYAEIVEARNDVRKAFPSQRALIFIYPGYTNADKRSYTSEEQQYIRDYFIACRNNQKDMAIPITDPYTGLTHQIIQASFSASTMAQWPPIAYQKGRWIVFVYHNIVEDSQATGVYCGKSSADACLKAIGEAASDGLIWNCFLEDGFLYVHEWANASAEVKVSKDSSSISLDVTDKLDNEIYNFPITAKVSVPSTWESVKLIHADKTEEDLVPFTEKGVTYVYANVVPDEGTATLIEDK